VWDERYEDIVAFERHLTRNGTVIVKFFLHLSKNEQRKRLLERIDCPEKNWKISTADMHERAFWDHYQHAYEKMLNHTSIEEAPWYIIPADRKWFTRAAIADVIVTHLKALRLAYPGTTPAQKLALAEDRKQLMDEQNEHDGLAEQDKHKNTPHTDEA
jgi:polyphosphate kinase 2 (PPK2 family)